MTRSPLPLSLLSLLPLTALPAPLADPPRAPVQGPFAEGTRWQHAPDPAAPWIPSSVALAGRGSLVWTSGLGPGGGLAVFDRAAFGSNPPLFEDRSTVGATHLVAAAGRRTDALFAAAQYPNPTVLQRRTVVTRHDPQAAVQGAGFDPLWSHDAGLTTNGPARLAVDGSGERVVLAVWDQGAGAVQVDWLDGTSGALDGRAVVPGAALNGIDLSADGSRTVVSAGLDLYVFDGGGALVHHQGLAAASHCTALSGDGRTLAVGGVGQVAVLSEKRGAWVLDFTVTAPPQEIAVSADLSLDGGVLGIGWWNAVTSVDARLEVWDTEIALARNERVLAGHPAGHQNLPQVVRVTDDGSRVAFGLWGDGVSTPEAVLLETDRREPLVEVDLSGSVLDLDLDEAGTALVIAHKNVHQNQFGSLGRVLLYESGLRTIVQLGPAAVGQGLRVATRLEGALVAFLLAGERVAPVPVGGVQGLLHLDRGTLTAQVAPTLAGRADFALILPDDPALVGTHLALQPAFRAPAGTLLPQHVLEPLVLD